MSIYDLGHQMRPSRTPGPRTAPRRASARHTCIPTLSAVGQTQWRTSARPKTGDHRDTKGKIRILVGGQALAALLAILLFTQPGMWSNLVGWTLGAVLVSAFFASKNQIAAAQGRRAAHYVGLDRASSVLLAVGMSAAFAHAFFIATELAK